jgi:pimeloyl-ACP methyl ester carboxylesterase
VLVPLIVFVAAPLSAPLFLLTARTWRGRVAAVAWLPLLPLAVLFPALPYLEGSAALSWVSPVLAVGGVAVVACGVCLYATKPRCHQHPGPGLYSLQPGVIPPNRPPRWKAPPVSEPEADLVRFGLFLVTRFDPRLSRASARTVRRVTRQLLAEVEADPAYRELYPVGRYGLWSLAHGQYLWWHLNAYVPNYHVREERLGTLIFLHGHGGNFQVQLHAWRRFADEYGFAVVCPTFGYGNWEHPDGVEAVAWALDRCRESDFFDPGRVYLAGLSQGGCGVGRAGAAMPGAFAGLVFISPAMEPDVLGSPEFVAGWKGRPVLVVHGGRDRHVRPATVDAAVGQMQADGVAVTYHRDPDADHFLFFAKLAEMHQLVGGWMAGLTPGR